LRDHLAQLVRAFGVGGDLRLKLGLDLSIG